MTAPEILYLTMMSVMKVCSRSQNLCPGRSVKNASIGLSIAGCDFSGVEGYRAGCFVGVAERAFFPSGDAEVPCPLLVGSVDPFRLNCVKNLKV